MRNDPAAQPAAPRPPEKKRSKLGGCMGIGVLIVVALGIIGVLAPDQKDDGAGAQPGNSAAATASTDPADQPLEVTARELYSAYDYNEASAQGYFGKRKLLVSGTVDKVTLDFSDDPVVGLKVQNQFTPVQASLADDARDEGASFGPGDKVKLLCEDVSEVIGTPMLKDCRTAPAGMKGQPVQWSSK